MSVNNDIINSMTDEEIRDYIEDSYVDEYLSSIEFQESKYL